MLKLGRLHLITDTSTQSRFSHLDLVQMAIRMGAPTIQYREKSFRRETHLAELMTIARLCRQHRVQLFVNDYVEVAVEVGASGVHLGEEDTPIEVALRQLPPLMVVGASVHSLEYYQRIRHLPLAYVGVGPVFESPTKPGSRPPLGIEGLRQLVEAISHPVIAIGGITPKRAQELFAAIPKLYGVAVISAFVQAPDPEAAIRELLAAIPPE
jgi:thiamine-phosphate pyrophosphorylase